MFLHMFCSVTSVVDCELFYRVQLPGCGSSLVPHTQVLVDLRTLWVVHWAMSSIVTPPWPTMTSSIVESICPTKWTQHEICPQNLSHGSRGFANVVGGPLSNVSNCIHSLANNANFHCCVHLSHERGGVMVSFSQQAPICRGILQSTNLQGNLARVNCWLRDVMLIDWAISQTNHTYISIIRFGQLRCDCQTLEIELWFHFRNWLFAKRMANLLEILLLKSS